MCNATLCPEYWGIINKLLQILSFLANDPEDSLLKHEKKDI